MQINRNDIVGRAVVAAEYPGCPLSYSTLCRLSAKGEGPRHVKLGGRYFYFRRDIEALCRGESFGTALIVIDEAALAERRAAIAERRPTAIAAIPAPTRGKRRRGRPTKAAQRARLAANA